MENNITVPTFEIVSDFPAHQTNPFIESLSFTKRNKMVSVGNKTLPLVDSNTGEIETCAFIGIKEKVDSEKFTKIFHAQIKSLFDLSQSGIKVFGYIMSNIGINEGFVFFSLKECMDFTGYKSRKSIFEGLAELLKAGFIAKSRSNTVYFINPAIFVNGDRMIVVKEYEKEKANVSIQ